MNRDLLKKALFTALVAATIPFALWAMDQRIDQNVQQSIDGLRIQLIDDRITYLEMLKLARPLTDEEKTEMQILQRQRERMMNDKR